MQYVKDSTGDDWFLEMNLGVAEELDAFCREAYEVEVFDAVRFMSLLSRPINVVSIASCLCREQREKKDMTPSDFGRRWKGESAYNLQRALWNEYSLFYPNPATQELINSTITQLQHLEGLEKQAVAGALKELETTMTKAVEELVSTINNG